MIYADADADAESVFNDKIEHILKDGTHCLPLVNVEANPSSGFLASILLLFTKGLVDDPNDEQLIRLEMESSLRNPNPYYTLILSSCCFFSSGIIAAINGIWVYFIVSLITTIVSVNHWRDVRKGPRRTMDLVGAKVSFLIFFLSGCFSIQVYFLWTVAVPIVGAMIFLYYISNRLRNQGIQYWVYVHFIFHLLVAGEQAIVVYWIAENIKDHSSYWRIYDN